MLCSNFLKLYAPRVLAIINLYDNLLFFFNFYKKLILCLNTPIRKESFYLWLYKSETRYTYELAISNLNKDRTTVI